MNKDNFKNDAFGVIKSSVTDLMHKQKADALLMLDYASAKGMAIPRHVLEDLLAFDPGGEPAVSSPLYGNFIKSFSEMAKIISPANTESIQYATFQNKRGRLIIESRSNIYSAIGVLVFVCLFAAQGYWFLLNGLVNDVKQTLDALIPYAQLQQAIGDRLHDKLKRAATDQEIDEEAGKIYDQAGQQALDVLTGKKVATGQTLSDPKDRLTGERQNFLRLSLISDFDAMGRFVGSIPRVFENEQTDKSVQSVYYLWDMSLQKIRILQTAQMVLDILNHYVLPIIYGLLGSCLYIIRRLTSEIRYSIATRDSIIELKTRFFLGGVSGLIVAWFVLPKTTSTVDLLSNSPGTLSSLSPLVLSFIAGYAIEIVFSAIDNIVSAFSGKKKDGASG